MKNGIIIEDNLLAQQWLTGALKTSFTDIAVTVVADYQAAIDYLQSPHSQNIALIDIDLPDGCGIDLIPIIKHSNPDCLCVIATIFDDDKSLFRAMSIGADGYILKDQSQIKIAGILKRIEDGYPPLSPSIARRLLGSFRAPVAERKTELTPREQDVLALIAKGYTLADTAKYLRISYHTACGYSKEIYNKLNINSRAEATIEAIKKGLISPN